MTEQHHCGVCFHFDVQDREKQGWGVCEGVKGTQYPVGDQQSMAGGCQLTVFGQWFPMTYWYHLFRCALHRGGCSTHTQEPDFKGRARLGIGLLVKEGAEGEGGCTQDLGR